MSDINTKNSPNQMRHFLGKLYNPGKQNTEHIKAEEIKKELTLKDMLKITRRLNEEVATQDVDGEKEQENKETVYDQRNEEEKIKNYFSDMRPKVNIRFFDLLVFSDLVYWGGTVDGVIQFTYSVTPDEDTSGITFDYTEDFTPDNPHNEDIKERLEAYFDVFSDYWQSNVIQH